MEIVNFKPNIYNSNGHVQTLLGSLYKVNNLSNNYRKELLTLSDGDTISYHHYEGNSNFVVSIGHGLTGSNRSNYIKSITHELNKNGHTVIAFNHRNCGDGLGLSKKTYHSGRSQDLGELIKHLKCKFPNKRHITIGFSMSGNIALKLLGDPSHEKQSEVAFPDYAIAINPPINIGKTSELLSQGLNRIYQYNFIKSLRHYINKLESLGLMTKKYSVSELKTTMPDFDRLFTGPESGYNTAEKYYKECSAVNFLENIKIPTLIITAKDDPFIDYTDFDRARKNSAIQLSVQEHGGHIGYISEETLPHGTKRWIDFMILNSIKKLENTLSV